MNPPSCEILFFRPTKWDLLGQRVAHWTWGPYCHVGMVFYGPATECGIQYWESKPGCGVHCIDDAYQALALRDMADRFMVEGITPDEAKRAWSWWLAHKGDPYDFWGLHGFVTHHSKEHGWQRGRWFCSEAVFEAVQQHGGVRLLNETEAWKVDPNLLARASRLTPYDPVKWAECQQRTYSKLLGCTND